MTSKSSLKDLELFQELSDPESKAVAGGRMKLPLETVKKPGLMSPDGSPIAVYVDGLLVNSVTTGYYGG